MMCISDLMIFFFILLVLAFGALVSWTIFVHSLHKRQEKIIADITDNDQFCECNCKHWEQCFSNHSDPDEAFKELDPYCMACPLVAAIDLYEEEKRKNNK